MTKEETLFQRRLLDLANMADQRNIVLFSDFLSLNELNIYHSSKKELGFVTCRLFGGYEAAERQMIAFIPDALYYDWDYPIACIRIRPLNVKFAEELGHRDILGALMNLGIERSKTGDIALEENEFYLFCCQNFICSFHVPYSLHFPMFKTLSQVLTRDSQSAYIITLA